MEPIRWNVSATYVTGANNMKVGYIGAFYWNISRPSTNNFNLAYRFNNGVPNQITENLHPYQADTRVRMNALYWQDTWTRGNLTLQGALRYDHSWSYYPAQQVGPTRFLPTPLVFPETQGVVGTTTSTRGLASRTTCSATGRRPSRSTWAGISRRRWPATGTTRRSCPSRASRRPRPGRGPTGTATSSPIAICRTRWPRPPRPDFCGQISDLNFGKTVNTLSYDPQIMQGWYNRPSDWIVGATFQHEILPRVSVSAGYTRRWLQHFTVTDNRSQSVADYTPFSITAPSRSASAGRRRLRGVRPVQRRAAGGQPGRQLPHVFNRHLAGLQRHRSQYHGADAQPPASGREHDRAARHRLLRRAGAVAGAERGVLDRQRSAGVQPDEPLLPLRAGVRHEVHSVGTYTFPKIDVLFSGTLTSSPGIPLRADWTVSSARRRSRSAGRSRTARRT